jgi:Esterase/lipase
MKRQFLFLLFGLALFCACSKAETTTPEQPVDDDLEGPISRPASGYGKDGAYEVAETNFASPEYPGKDVAVFYPKGTTAPRPTVFYLHGFGGENKISWMGIFNFIAKKGYTVVFAPYPTLNSTIDGRYDVMWSSFRTAVKKYPNLIDSTKVGFVGHSFGGGAVPSIAYKAFQERGWGKNGRFIFTLAPWYAYQITDEQLKNFPANTQFISQVYDDDDVNDHRMAIDIYKNISIPNSEKDFVTVKKSVVEGYTYTAEHNLPSSLKAYDAYDYYCLYRLLDALMDYSFNKSASGKNVALGNGSAEQITLPSYKGTALTTLEVTDNPVPKYTQDKYEFPCGGLLNPRSLHCE